jgi:hypothetical protein
MSATSLGYAIDSRVSPEGADGHRYDQNQHRGKELVTVNVTRLRSTFGHGGPA